MGQPNGGGWSSILRNAEKASAKFGYDEDTGYFGSRLKGKSRDLRTLISDNPIKDARELFRQLSVEINVKSDKTNTKVKNQKIHFIKKG